MSILFSHPTPPFLLRSHRPPLPPPAFAVGAGAREGLGASAGGGGHAPRQPRGPSGSEGGDKARQRAPAKSSAASSFPPGPVKSDLCRPRRASEGCGARPCPEAQVSHPALLPKPPGVQQVGRSALAGARGYTSRLTWARGSASPFRETSLLFKLLPQPTRVLGLVLFFFFPCLPLSENESSTACPGRAPRTPALPETCGDRNGSPKGASVLNKPPGDPRFSGTHCDSNSASF